jgi:hypothetical protein
MVGRSDVISIPGVTFLAPDYGPCIICGHPTGDCTEEDHAITFMDENSDSVLVEEDIVERRWVTPNHLAKVLVVAAGTHISRSEAEKLGLV